MPVPFEVVRVIEKEHDSASLTVVSFFTVDTLYEKEVEHLIKSLDKFQISYRIFAIKAASDVWVEVCQIKPHIIKMVLDSTERNVCWLDADSTLVRDPLFLKNPPPGFAAFGHQKRPNEYMSGTVLFRADDDARELVRQWIDLQEQPEHIGKSWDQAVMSLVFVDNANKVGVLPPEYLKKFDKKGANPIVVHWMASREYVRKIKRNTRSR